MNDWADFLMKLKLKIINHMADNNLTIKQIAKEHNFDEEDLRIFLSFEEDIYVGALYHFCNLIGLNLVLSFPAQNINLVIDKE